MSSGKAQNYVCVFAGSSEGRLPVYAQAAQNLGRVIARNGFGLVYGGASVGLMNAVAEGALCEGAEVIGILPEWLESWEVAHRGLTELRIVASMHERKAQMAALADTFIVLPGGIGSLEECFEIWTWSQLSIHQKSIGLLNVNGYYDQLQAFMDHTVREGFLRAQHRQLLLSESDPQLLLDALVAQSVPSMGKWEQT
ncbi:MAG: TIGR00730 family Rossman fold protein [bacterium]